MAAVYCDGVHYRQERVNCGKPTCRTCSDFDGHGPYWYAYSVQGCYTRKKYIGKKLPPAVERAAVPVVPGMCNSRDFWRKAVEARQA
jgi:hypothetical protein